MWEPRRLTTQWASTASYRDSFTILFGGMRNGKGNQSTQRKPAPVPLCPPQNPHELIWNWTRTTVVESQQLTARAMAPRNYIILLLLLLLLPIIIRYLFTLYITFYTFTCLRYNLTNSHHRHVDSLKQEEVQYFTFATRIFVHFARFTHLTSALFPLQLTHIWYNFCYCVRPFGLLWSKINLITNKSITPTEYIPSLQANNRFDKQQILPHFSLQPEILRLRSLEASIVP
jgi:hypothetical protein